MPNWCEGQLKIRGKGKDVFEFFKEEITGLIHNPKTFDNDIILINDYTTRKFVWSEGKDYFYEPNVKLYEKKQVDTNLMYIRESRRMFIDEDYRELKFWKSDMDEIIIKSVKCRQAWDFDPNDLTEWSFKHNIDLRFYGFEQGCEFNREIEIIKGEITKDEVIKYNDYQWESPFNDIGG